jgi:putative endonuclease
MLGLILTMNQKRDLMLFHVYILSNKQRGILYIGITNNLARRIYEHKQKIADGFSKKYNLTMLVYAEEHDNPNDEIERKKIGIVVGRLI